MEKFKQAIIVLVFVVIVILWLKEVTERRARHAADRFVGPALEQFEWLDESFQPWLWRDATNRRHGFAWNVRYDERFRVSDFPLVVEVDLMGRVRSTSYEKFDKWITLSDVERKREQVKWSETERRKLCPTPQ